MPNHPDSIDLRPIDDPHREQAAQLLADMLQKAKDEQEQLEAARADEEGTCP